MSALGTGARLWLLTFPRLLKLGASLHRVNPSTEVPMWKGSLGVLRAGCLGLANTDVAAV